MTDQKQTSGKLKMDAREVLSDLEHQQWMKWAKDIVTKEAISTERKVRWFKYFVHYSELSEEVKEFDREWADKAIKALDDAGFVIVPKKVYDYVDGDISNG